MQEELLHLLYERGKISELDMHFAKFMTELGGSGDLRLAIAAALVSNCTRLGHICLDLKSLAVAPPVEGKEVGEDLFGLDSRDWKMALRGTSVVGMPGENKPLILDGKARLYLYRYWEYQEILATLVKGRVTEDSSPIYFSSNDVYSLKEALDRFFGRTPIDRRGDEKHEIDWQKVAAFVSLRKKLCVISGGPGTGKTTTVAKILGLLIERLGIDAARIALAAPTGKAAARLQEAIKASKENLNCADNIRASIPEEATTIHRLLGTIAGSCYFRYNAENRLPVDIVVIDEASMVDLALMSKLIQAVPPEARLILLGDKDQLASVEAGAVLGDICDTGKLHVFSRDLCVELETYTGYKLVTPDKITNGSSVKDCIVQLEKSFRFGEDSGIRTISHAVNRGDGRQATGLLREKRFSDIRWVALPQRKALPAAIKKKVIIGFEGYLKAGDIYEAFELFDRFRILCALRKGSYGVEGINLEVEQILSDHGLIEAKRSWYRGRPLLITRNDYNLGLFNGDIGIIWTDVSGDSDLTAFFRSADGTVKRFHPVRLPEHETVYAMTVHKSQGSEFDTVLFVLPDKEYPVLTRELIYTGITRAKEDVEIWGKEDVFHIAVSRPTERMSGLRDALWDGY